MTELLASMDFTEPNLTLPRGPQPLGQNHFCALSLGELKIIKPISGQATAVFELLLLLGSISSSLSFLLCFPASLSFILLMCTCDVMWPAMGYFPGHTVPVTGSQRPWSSWPSRNQPMLAPASMKDNLPLKQVKVPLE